MNTKDFIIWTIVFIIILIIIIIIFIWWCKSQDPYQLLNWWNKIIREECILQDTKTLCGIPSYYEAENFHQSNIRDLHTEIRINHDKILMESIEYMNSGGGVPMIEMDITQSKFFGQKRWTPLWVKFVNGWAPGSENLPTLKRIAEKIPGIALLHVSVMGPGTILPYHVGPSKSVYRYHYGLKVPKTGDLGLKIENYYIRWKDRHGFVWDDTLNHTAWNKTKEYRLIIFADVKRDLGTFYNLGTDIIYWMISMSKYSEEACDVIKKYVSEVKKCNIVSHNLKEMLIK